MAKIDMGGQAKHGLWGPNIKQENIYLGPNRSKCLALFGPKSYKNVGLDILSPTGGGVSTDLNWTHGCTHVMMLSGIPICNLF